MAELALRSMEGNLRDAASLAAGGGKGAARAGLLDQSLVARALLPDREGPHHLAHPAWHAALPARLRLRRSPARAPHERWPPRLDRARAAKRGPLLRTRHGDAARVWPR